MMGRTEWMSYCVWSVGTAFAFPVKLTLSQSISLLAFLLFSLHQAGKGNREWVAGWWWGQLTTTLIPALCMESGEIEVENTDICITLFLSCKTWVSFKIYFEIKSIFWSHICTSFYETKTLEAFFIIFFLKYVSLRICLVTLVLSKLAFAINDWAGDYDYCDSGISKLALKLPVCIHSCCPNPE